MTRLVLVLWFAAALSPCLWAVDGESPARWFREGQAAVLAAKHTKPVTGKAKNVILFIGDGMGVSTVTAARILDGQRRGHPGEENLLFFETLPFSALIKTYNTNQQTADSAGAMSAIVTGIKTKAGVLSVTQNVIPGDHESTKGKQVATIFELAEQAGLSTGIVSTARITHATAAACYAHTPQRDWEHDGVLTEQARLAGFADIARQLIDFPFGDGIDVVLGGGRRAFFPQTWKDPEHPTATGQRWDGRNLTQAWLTRPRAEYVWNKAQFDKIDTAATDRLLGLFEWSHMQYEHDRAGDSAGEPSLAE
ncbi:MAG: alkaline phosphatase, partial [Acidobacteria bacterium]|nr:alkaline phosphatase [Acidobacteriota bacterium]